MSDSRLDLQPCARGARTRRARRIPAARRDSWSASGRDGRRCREAAARWQSNPESLIAHRESLIAIPDRESQSRIIPDRKSFARFEISDSGSDWRAAARWLCRIESNPESLIVHRESLIGIPDRESQSRIIPDPNLLLDSRLASESDWRFEIGDSGCRSGIRDER